MMVAEIDPGATTFNAGVPAESFAYPYAVYPFEVTGRAYDLAPDGERFLLRKAVGTEASEESLFTRLIYVDNWFEELKARVPTN